MANKLVRYFSESYQELTKKTTWPTYSELQSSAIVVFVAALLIAVVVFVMDILVGINSSTMGFWKGILGFIYSLA
jgi:preprotein translocase subunit SecE